MKIEWEIFSDLPKKKIVQWNSNKLLFTSMLPFVVSWEIYLNHPTSTPAPRHNKIQSVMPLFDLPFMSYLQFIFPFPIYRKLWGLNNVNVVRRNPSYASRTANYTFWDWKSFNIFFANPWGNFCTEYLCHTIFIFYKRFFDVWDARPFDWRWIELSARGMG